MSAALQIRSLSLDMGSDNRVLLDDVSLEVAAGETVGIVGESGSGKSLTALSVLQLLPGAQMRIVDGSSIRLQERELIGATGIELERLRGARVAIVFQEPLTALNPVRSIGSQLCEVIERHAGLVGAAARERAHELLRDVRIVDPERVFDSYPHQLSGGMRQRVLIAMAFSSEPALLIADEATTALDVTVQAQILELLKALVRDRGIACLMISHDLAVVRQSCDRVYVMHRGRVVESGSSREVIENPRHPYTQSLLASLPALRPAREVTTNTSGCVLEVESLSVRHYRTGRRRSHPASQLTAVEDVSLELRTGETLALVGESGCGKSSLLAAIAGLVPSEGVLRFAGHAGRPAPGFVQMVFQDPLGSLNPQWPAWRIVSEPAAVQARLSRRACRELTVALFDKVGLEPAAIDRLPREFSGGQRQRLAIARALSVGPKLVLLDEPTSALDVSIQAQIIDLLLDLQRRERLAYLFVSHDFAVVRQIADRIAVMRRGCIVESGPAGEVLDHPCHAYTRELLAAVPRI
jgi:ABC-type microcin C transport system duplicated ATPase subunit YejF